MIPTTIAASGVGSRAMSREFDANRGRPVEAGG